MDNSITLADYFRINLSKVGGPFRCRVSAEPAERMIVQEALDDIFIEADAVSRLEYVFSGISLDHGVLKKLVRSGDVYCSAEDVRDIYVLLGHNANEGHYVLVSIIGSSEKEKRGTLAIKTEGDILNMKRMGYVY